MADQPRSKIIQDNPIGKGLDIFRTSFKSICEDKGLSHSPNSLHQLGQDDLPNLALALLCSLPSLPASRLLLSKTGRGTLRSDLLRLISAVCSDGFDFDRTKSLLNAALVDKPDDARIWDQVYHAITESTPPPRPIASSLQQTPWLRNTSSFANSSEHRKYVGAVLKKEFGPLYVGLRNFHDTFFRSVAGLETASGAAFEKCIEGSNPLFRAEEGWKGWPEDADQDRVLGWLADLSDKLAAFAENHMSIPSRQRRLLAKPNKHIDGSIGRRKMAVGFVNEPKAGKDSRCHWSQILVPGELKTNRSADIASESWLDLGRYAREVLAAQDTRRFVLGFTICGSFMRVWEFDRLGGIASEPFNMNEDGLLFVSTILGFLWMSEEELGFDPTIRTANGQRFIEIERNGSTERLVIDKVMRRARCIAGRATTCWKAHREEEPRTPFVIKDSWQYLERDDEGELLREATSRDVVNVARYYYHGTIRVRGNSDIRHGVRKGLDITEASNYRPGRSILSPSTSASATRKGRSSKAGLKRSSSQTGAVLPPSKRPCLVSPMKAGSSASPNRVHRRVILRDYGKPIYEASSRAALLSALEGCIDGHESLRKAGLLHRDISINNLMINEDEENPSWPSFLIDLDHAIKEQQREGVTGARGMTGTRAFMAIGVLCGEEHSFMHDLESFFWVLFWICIHYNGPGEDIGSTEFERWYYESNDTLAALKKGRISDERDYMKGAERTFTPYYQPLIPWVNRLRREVFPNGNRWKKANPELYFSIKEILREAREDPMVLGVI
ncbi:hypothetical protein F4823DRAFT_267708 [Ustulina deusta]|nr:hypothetical protein F4823DRAFT_267708 [Ustulina deusta]